MDKTLSKAVMLGTKSRNKVLSPKVLTSFVNKFSYTNQKDWCISLLRKKRRKKHFVNFNEKNKKDNKKI